MYQSILNELKPLVFEGKTGMLELFSQNDDIAHIYIKEGLITQVATKKLKGKQAASTCVQWLSTVNSFQEGKTSPEPPDKSIDTMDIISFLEKAEKNIQIINNKIGDGNKVYAINQQDLQRAKNLDANDMKLALLFDGRKNINQIVAESKQPELAVLTRICRLIMAGVARETQVGEAIEASIRDNFLDELNDKILDFLGPAASVVIEDAFADIGSSPEQLTKEQLPLLMSKIRENLDTDERNQFDVWSKSKIKEIS